MNLSDACGNFLLYCQNEKKLSPHTIRAYQGDLDCFGDIVGMHNDLQNFSEVWIENAAQLWLASATLKTTTVKRRVACIKALVRWLFRKRLIAFNPLERLHLEIKLPKRLPRNLQTMEIKRLLIVKPESIVANSRKKKNPTLSRRQWDSLTARLAIEVMTLTGLRVGELVKITPLHIDHALQQIRIVGKGDRERQVSFPDLVTTTRLQAYRDQAYSLFGTESAQTLFLNGLGRSANEQYIRRIIRIFANDAKLERRVTPHMLRHYLPFLTMSRSFGDIGRVHSAVWTLAPIVPSNYET